MLIVLEGPDCVGKTTLANQLATAMRPTATILHKGPPDPGAHALDEWVKPLKDYKPGNGNLILDRWHLGEPIYSDIKHRRSILDQASWTYIDLFLASRGALKLILTLPEGELRRMHERMGETFVTADELVDIDWWYRKVMFGGWSIQHSRMTSVQSIVNAAVRMDVEAHPLRAFDTYVGAPKPELLLLGERVGPRNQGKTALMPYPSTSGKYLLDACGWIAWGGVGIANACQEDPVFLWDVLGKPRVVTLGREAHKACEDAELAHGAVPHPQYVRRFHHRKIRQYSALILKAMHTQEVYLSWPR